MFKLEIKNKHRLVLIRSLHTPLEKLMTATESTGGLTLPNCAFKATTTTVCCGLADYGLDSYK